MADVTLKYKGATIGELSESGNKTLKTAGKYCEADIELEYVKPQGGGGKIPSEYQEVEWISNANTARIDLGDVAVNPKGVILDMKFDVVPSSTGIMATNDAVGSAGTWFGILSSGSAGLGGGSNFSFNALERRTYTVNFANDGVSAEADGVTVSRSVSTLNTNLGISLFATLNSNSFNCKATLYECKVFAINGICKHLIPCYRKADSVIGLYDIINDRFFSNANSGGNFTKGADVN